MAVVDSQDSALSVASLHRAGRTRLILTLAITAWAIAIAIGLTVSWRYEHAPGAGAIAPARWPAASRIPAPHDRSILIMVLHPQCACSRASVAELARLMARAPGWADAYVLFLSPAGMPEGWVESDLWRTAAAIPGTAVVRDNSGAEARLFGAATSGQTLLYDASGRLLFSGGLTASRGLEGDNLGRAAIESLLNERPADASTAVFGCALFDSVGAAKSTRRNAQ